MLVADIKGDLLFAGPNDPEHRSSIVSMRIMYHHSTTSMPSASRPGSTERTAPCSAFDLSSAKRGPASASQSLHSLPPLREVIASLEIKDDQNSPASEQQSPSGPYVGPNPLDSARMQTSQGPVRPERPHPSIRGSRFHPINQPPQASNPNDSTTRDYGMRAYTGTLYRYDPPAPDRHPPATDPSTKKPLLRLLPGLSPTASGCPPAVYEGIGTLGSQAVYLYAGGYYLPMHVDGAPVNAQWGLTKANTPRKRLAAACDRCRVKKTRCDLRVAGCSPCRKAGAACSTQGATTTKVPTAPAPLQPPVQAREA